jgi:hypothetical protein
MGKLLEAYDAYVAKKEQASKRRVAKLGTLVAIVGGVICAADKPASADIVRVYDWRYFTSGASHEKNLDNNSDFTDNSAVPGDRNYHFGFSLNETGGERICGNASNNTSPFSIQRVMGKYADMAFGERPTGMICNHDLTGDGIADYNTVTGVLALDGTDDIYVAGNFFGLQAGDAYGGKTIGGIELDGTLDDMSALPSWPDVSTSKVYLPSINLVPEPSALAVLALGGAGLAVRRKRR